MLLIPKSIGTRTLPQETLEQDKKDCFKAGPCGVGKEALYLGGRFLDRRYYICWREIRRVYKRVAMSKGGFSGKGLFGSIAYLVVEFGKGKEVKTRFKRETDVDKLLERIEKEHEGIPTHSAKAERKLADAAAAEEAKLLKELTPEAAEAVERLRRAQSYLEQNTSLSTALTAAAKQKRVADSMNPAFKVGAVVLVVISAALALYGAYGLIEKINNALYFLLGGIVLFAFVLATNTLPSKWNSRRGAQEEWEKAVANCKKYTDAMPDFPVPPQYAHPVVLERMIRAIRQGRAKTEAEAYKKMKSELKGLNSSVTVSQKEYDEVVAIKPMFLVSDYKDEL